MLTKFDALSPYLQQLGHSMKNISCQDLEAIQQLRNVIQEGSWLTRARYMFQVRVLNLPSRKALAGCLQHDRRRFSMAIRAVSAFSWRFESQALLAEEFGGGHAGVILEDAIEGSFAVEAGVECDRE